MAVAIPPNFAYVTGVVGASVLVHHFYMSFKVVGARNKYNVKYPDLYATKDNCPNETHRNAFNCVQRGHQNCLENQPAFLALLTTVGLKYPLFASGAGIIYLIGKVLYMEGYCTGNPNKRMRGALSYLGLLPLLGSALWLGAKAVMGQ